MSCTVTNALYSYKFHVELQILYRVTNVLYCYKCHVQLQCAVTNARTVTFLTVGTRVPRQTGTDVPVNLIVTATV